MPFVCLLPIFQFLVLIVYRLEPDHGVSSMRAPYGLVAINLNFGGFYHDPLAILDHIA